METGEPKRAHLGEIAAPTLLIHGDSEPVFPRSHAEALANEIPGAPALAGAHGPPAVWDSVVPTTLDHTAERQER